MMADEKHCLEPMLSALLSPETVFPAEWDLLISGITSDSRKVVPGDLFVACPGYRVDGRDFVDDAVQRGAAAVICEKGKVFTQNSLLTGDVPLLVCCDLHKKSGEIASLFYGNPSADIKVLGITGTNGKTSCSHLIASAVTAMSIKAGVIGTMGSGLVGHLSETMNTTPEAITLQKALATLRDSGVKIISMEVSSHALSLSRVQGVGFCTALLTNLSRDHLDFHGTMDAYRKSKTALFFWEGLQSAVLNLDDEFGEELSRSISPAVHVMGFALSEKSTPGVYAKKIQYLSQGLEIVASTPEGVVVIFSKLMGRFNVSNLLASLAALMVSGFSAKESARALSLVRPIEGRMCRFGGNDQPMVIIDYAHTPEGLKAALNAVKEHFDRRVVVVFGCGGDRDNGKRAEMGAVASCLADQLFITADNPRGEEVCDISKQILKGIVKNKSSQNSYCLINNREKAIAQAIASATPCDVVLIAGKGHENYQEIKGERFHFSDQEHVEAALVKWRGVH